MADIYVKVPVELVRSKYPTVEPHFENCFYIKFAPDEPQTITPEMLDRMVIPPLPEVRNQLLVSIRAHRAELENIEKDIENTRHHALRTIYREVWKPTFGGPEDQPVSESAPESNPDPFQAILDNIIPYFCGWFHK